MFEYTELDEFEVICERDGKIWFEPVAEPFAVKGGGIPDWCDWVVHRNLGPWKAGEFWVVTDRRVYSYIQTVDSSSRDAAVQHALLSTQARGKDGYLTEIEEVTQELILGGWKK